MFIAIAEHGRGMIRSDRPSETDIIVSLHRGVHINLAFVMKCFFKLKFSASNIPEMNKMDGLSFAKLFYDPGVYRFPLTRNCPGIM